MSARRPTADVDRPRRFRGDDGSVIAELALVSPMLILLALGIFEYGFIFRNSTLLASGLRSSARSASQSKNSASADLLTLQTFMASTGKLKNATVVRVIIYRSTSSSAAPPATCLSASTAGSPPHGVSGTGGVYCNVYTAADLTPANLVASNFNCVTAATPAWDDKYCPDMREATAIGSLDYIGVYAEVQYSGITGLLPGRTLLLKDQAISRMEPVV